MVVDGTTPRDPQCVARAIAAWASDRFGGPVSVDAAAPLSGGLDNFVHGVLLVGRSLPSQWTGELVARVSPSADRGEAARAEAVIQNWCAAAGYPAPNVLAVLDRDWSLGLPAQIAERVPGTTMLDAMKATPLRSCARVPRTTPRSQVPSVASSGRWTASTALTTRRATATSTR